MDNKYSITPGLLGKDAKDASTEELCELLRHITAEAHINSFGTHVRAPISPTARHNAQRITEICQEASKRLYSQRQADLINDVSDTLSDTISSLAIVQTWLWGKIDETAHQSVLDRVCKVKQMLEKTKHDLISYKNDVIKK